MTEKDPIIIVGIGASAGGLEALQLFVKHLPDNTEFAYVVAQHLSPTYKSLMATLLSKETEHKVLEAKNGLKVMPDHMYVCPPNKNITIHDDIIYLKEISAGTYGPKPSIDILFESLSVSKGDKAAGVILSGTGSDGSRGIRAIKAEGGYTIAQDPESAKYDGMPLAAINTGNIDLILKPEEMGQELNEIFCGENRPTFITPNTEDTHVLRNILNKLQEAKAIDFSLYKVNTIQRRIERRMAALKISSITHYNNHLKKNPDEVNALFKDILIGVTSFFRDNEAFMGLKKSLGAYLEKKEDSTLRIWAPGCSTGEEAYSVAMVISEILGADIGRYTIQIFATDIDETATNLARKGLYPESALLDMDKGLRNKYFVPRKDNYEVIKPVREMVIFSRHDIIKDPPFLKLDLIVCRNLLIYFNAELQRKLFPIFHYALNDYGLLFLGKSESVGHFQSHFLTVDKKWKIYSAAFLGKKAPPISQMKYQSGGNDEEILQESKAAAKAPTVEEMMQAKINAHVLPTCIVINDTMDIVYVKGENPYISYPEGTRNDNVFRNVKPVLSTELRAAIHRIRSENHPLIKTKYQRVELYGDVERFVRMLVMRLDTPKHAPLYMTCFQEELRENMASYANVRADGLNDERFEQLELELARTKEHLQTVIEELETNNEEMQSLNEELQSSNEELQSSNEELETTNEELQSTNEELQTAYTELKATYDEKEERVRRYVRLEEAMERSQDRYTTALETIGLGLYDHHVPIHREDFWSADFSDVLGYRPGELPADKSLMLEWLRDRIHEADRDNYDHSFQDFIAGKLREFRVDARVRHKDGSWRWIRHHARSAARDSDQHVNRIIGTIRDVTDAVRERWQLQLFQEQYGMTQRFASIGFWRYHVDEERFHYDETTLRLLGREHVENWIDLVTPEQTVLVRKLFLDACSGRSELHTTIRLAHSEHELRVFAHRPRAFFDPVVTGMFQKDPGHG